MFCPRPYPRFSAQGKTAKINRRTGKKGITWQLDSPLENACSGRRGAVSGDTAGKVRKDGPSARPRAAGRRGAGSSFRRADRGPECVGMAKHAMTARAIGRKPSTGAAKGRRTVRRRCKTATGAAPRSRARCGGRGSGSDGEQGGADVLFADSSHMKMSMRLVKRLFMRSLISKMPSPSMRTLRPKTQPWSKRSRDTAMVPWRTRRLDAAISGSSSHWSVEGLYAVTVTVRTGELVRAFWSSRTSSIMPFRASAVCSVSTSL